MHKYNYTTTHNTEFIFHLNQRASRMIGSFFGYTDDLTRNRKKKFSGDPIATNPVLLRKKLEHAYLVFPSPKHYSTFLHTHGFSERVIVLYTPVKF